MAQVLREGGGFNLKLSDALPLDRDTPDHRHGACRSGVQEFEIQRSMCFPELKRMT